METTCLLDTGVQRSLLLSNIASKLNLKIIGKIKTVINWVNAEGEMKYYDIAKLHLRNLRGILKLECIIVDSLPLKISIPNISKTLNCLKAAGLRMAVVFVLLMNIYHEKNNYP